MKAFKPAGIPAVALREVVMTLDEYEALRLADREGLYQEAGARRMGVSRPTFGRILELAHSKVAEALVDGCLLLIEGGTVHTLTGKRAGSKNGGKSAPCPRCSKGSAPSLERTKGEADQTAGRPRTGSSSSRSSGRGTAPPARPPRPRSSRKS